MSEGGLFPWRVQKIQYPKNGHPGNYANLCRPLPDPPKDQIWVQDANTRDWKLVPLVVATTTTAANAAGEEEEESRQNDNTTTTAAVASSPVTNDNNNNHGITTAIPIPLPTVEVAIPLNYNNNSNKNSNTNNCNNNETSLSSNHYNSNGDGNRYHTVQSTDTFQGICLRYKITPTELRRANKMVLMDNNLTLYKRLIIPTTTTSSSPLHKGSNNGNNNNKNKQKEDGGLGLDPEKTEKIIALLSKASRGSNTNANKITKLTYSEARAYLEIEDWDMHRAIKSVGEDFGWSTSSHSSSSSS